MWFGDLVTMRWWNGIWLNEAFATFMEIAACDAYRPDWERWTSFGLERSGAFETDSLGSTRPVEFEVRSPADCDGMFDVLTYQKGGALLRMLEQYLGEERFREGVSHYLRTPRVRQHRDQRPLGRDRGDVGRTRPADHGQLDLAARLSARDGLPGRRDQLVLGQQPFRFDADGTEPGEQLWAIPIQVRNGGVTTTVLLDGPETTTTTRRPRRARRRQRRRQRLLPGRLRRHTSRTASTATHSPSSPPSSATTSSTTRGRRRRRPARGVRAAGRARRVRRRARARRLAGDRHRAPWARPAARRRRRPRRIPATRPALAGPALADLGEPARRRVRSDRQAARPAHRCAGRARRRRRRPGTLP